MLTVEGTFVPHRAGGFFFLWAHEPPEARPHRVRPAPAQRLSPLIRGVPYVSALTCTVQLPGARRFRRARVPGMAMGVAAAAQWLLGLDGAFAETGLKPAPSLRTWRAVAGLLMELLARGRFVPLLRTEAGCLSAAWAPTAPEGADAARLARLEAALPDVCRAVIPPDRNPRAYRPLPAGELIRLFLHAGTDSLARLYLEGTGPQLSPGGRWGHRAVEHWVRALTDLEQRDLPPGLPDGADLYTAVEAWAAPATGLRGVEALRTGLRLLPPEEEQREGWALELILQTTEPPIVTVPAQSAWEAIGQGLTIGDRRYQQADQRLLQDLPAMVRIFPPLEPLRFSAAPSRLTVSREEVIALLREGAAALQEAGFPVLLPAELAQPARLSVRMHLKPPSAAASEPRFGLSQLVDVHWDLALGDQPIRPEELERLAREKRPLVQYQGRWIQVDEQAIATALRALRPSREKVELGTALKLAPQVKETTAEGWVQELLVRLSEPARIERVPMPKGFQGALRPYQQRGLDWLAFLRRFGLGAILADDMGLGKTVQLTALLLHEREQGLTTRPTLLVCPVSVVGNWRRELARFAPRLQVLVHHGARRTDPEAFAREAVLHDVVITTYTLVARDEEALAAVPWAGVVADEAQHLKNPATRHARAMRNLPADYRIALTGTPVENHLGDLWALVAFIAPGYLGSAEEFRKTYAIPIERHQDEEATEKLRRLVGPLILRRLKSDPEVIGDLPEKLEHTIYATLTREQAALYEAVVQETLARSEDAMGLQRHGAVLAGLMKLKLICNHPAAVLGDAGPLAGRSGKLDRLTEMLEEVLAEGDQALIFTQFARFGARMQEYLSRRLDCPVLFLDGSTSRREREARIARFQGGEAPLFILSLKAGGVGLNLTAANHVFHFDRWWNPAVEDQATDRAYRIGQRRAVMVHKLVTAGTLEERIDQLLAEKRRLSDQVISTGESWLGDLTTEELRRLITLDGKEAGA